PLALPTMQKCHDLGYQLAIDDFGTGFSSLQYLASMPLHDLKIDLSFVSRMNGDAKAEAIVEVLIYLANLLGMKV
ncbi:EAL domain-containing protein, partial [Pseudomonas aeruginosa]